MTIIWHFGTARSDCRICELKMHLSFVTTGRRIFFSLQTTGICPALWGHDQSSVQISQPPWGLVFLLLVHKGISVVHPYIVYQHFQAIYSESVSQFFSYFTYCTYRWAKRIIVFCLSLIRIFIAMATYSFHCLLKKGKVGICSFCCLIEECW